MPIKIHELHIKATVGGDRPEAEPAGAGGAQEIDMQQIIAACVAQVLRILRKKEER